MPRTKLWTPREHKLLLRAWEEVPVFVGDGDRVYCARIHARFTELCAGDTERTESAVQRQRAVMLFNHNFITEFEQARRPDGQSWFELSPRGQEEIFNASASEKHQFMDMNAAVYARISRILKQRPLRAAPEQQHQQQPPEQRATKRKVEATPTDADFPAVVDWSHQELLHLVRAWRDEVKDSSSRANAKVKSKLNVRVYERFAILRGGSTTRTVPAVSTKRRDLLVSYNFIAKFNAAQRRIKKGSWFSLSKIDKVAVLRNTDKSRHISDIPGDVFDRIGEVLDGALDSGESGSSESEESDTSDTEVRAKTPNAATRTAKKPASVAEPAKRGRVGRFVSKDSLEAARDRPQAKDKSFQQLLGMVEAIDRQTRILTKMVRDMQHESDAERGQAASGVKRRLSEQLQGSPERDHGVDRDRRGKNLSSEAIMRLQNQGGGASWME